MPDENLLATLEQNLRQARATRSRLAARLADLEAEAEKMRTELNEMDAIVEQTKNAMFRILSSTLGAARAAAHSAASAASPSDYEIEEAIRRDTAQAGRYQPPPPAQHRAPAAPAAAQHVPHEVPPLRADIEPTGDRFFDRTIPQATTLLLREAAGPLHVNEIYNRLLEGGFQFTGQHPTISIAVSLNRNRRFRKVAPGTFDLVIRDAAQAS